MGNILSRIQEIALNEGITIGALERKIGASKGVLSRAINNGTDIQSKWLQIIVENYPTYSTRWLLTGKGSMLRSYGYQSFEEEYTSVVAEPPAIYYKTSPKNKVGDVPNAVPTSKPDESILYNIYKDEKAEWKAEKEELKSEKNELKAKVDNLNLELAETREELAVVKNRFADYKTYSEDKLRQLEAGVPGGKTFAKNVSIEKYSSRNADSATSANVPSE